MLHKKKIIVASLLSFGILMGGSFMGNSTALDAPMKLGVNKQGNESELSHQSLKIETIQTIQTIQTSKHKLKQDLYHLEMLVDSLYLYSDEDKIDIARTYYQTLNYLKGLEEKQQELEQELEQLEKDQQELQLEREQLKQEQQKLEKLKQEKQKLEQEQQKLKQEKQKLEQEQQKLKNKLQQLEQPIS